MTINDFMLTQVFTFLLIFCRVGSAMMLLPGIGEAYVSARVRLLLAAMFSLVLAPAMQSFPAPPESIALLAGYIFAEILTGLFMGTITRFLLSAVSMAGMIIAYQSSLASALVQDVTMSGGQGSSLSNLLGLSALVLFFVTGLHHLMLQTLADSYQIFKVGSFPVIADFTQHAVNTMNASFIMALQLSAPHIVIGLVIYLAGGIIGRLMPSFQVFFVIVAPNLMISFFVLMIVFSSIMMWYLDYFRESMLKFAGGG